MTLRPYQRDVIAAFDAKIEAGIRRVLMTAPTGAGKTIIASSVIGSAIELYKNVLVLAHRREITAQTSDKLRAHGIGHGIIQAGGSPRPRSSGCRWRRSRRCIGAPSKATP